MIVPVDTPSGSYPVRVSDSGLEGLGACIRSEMPNVQNLVCIVDTKVMEHHESALRMGLEGFAYDVVTVQGGEECKTVSSWANLVDELLGLGVDRTTPCVVIGGGSVGDLGGFAASTVMRGMPLIQVPTTLLAMVDSSVGGKTGLNTRHGKNLIGTFHQPSVVYVGLGTLLTLPEDEFLSGLGEVVKHAVLAGEPLFPFCLERSEDILARNTGALRHIVLESIRLKSNVVEQDEKEHGIRAILNLGHTVGHAIEQVSLQTKTPVPHGVCIAMGLYAEVRWAEEMSACRIGTSDAVREVLIALGLPVLPDKFDLEAALTAVKFDKKVRRGKLRTAIVEGVGRVRLTEIDSGEIRAMFYALEDA